jgi:predicted phosphodiesterase
MEHVFDFAKLKPELVDVLVLAGDICSTNRQNYSKHIGHFCDMYPNVVYVAGNHEYYGSTPEKTKAKILEVASNNKNLLYLDNSFAEISGQKFYGGTLWFEESVATHLYSNKINDFRAIKQHNGTFFFEENAKFKRNLEEIDANTIVVSHHLPSKRSISPQYKDNALNAFFLCDLEKEILVKRPKLYLHGHTHSAFDYRIDNTRVVCNPLGYMNEHGTSFTQNLVIEVD